MVSRVCIRVTLALDTFCFSLRELSSIRLNHSNPVCARVRVEDYRAIRGNVGPEIGCLTRCQQ